MREFNTSGPCDPALHYTVMREALIEEGKKKVNKGRFFTLFAPRQAGNYFQLLLQALEKDSLLPIWISFECLKTVSRAIFYRDLNNQLHQELAKYQIELDQLNFEEQIQGKQIYTYIIPTQFEQPSRLQSALAVKLSKTGKIACNMLKIGTLTIEQIAQATGIKTTRVEQLRDEL